MYNISAEFGLKVLIKGRPVTEYKHIDGNIYIEGRSGSEYELEFTNSSTGRVMIIPAVDGLSVIDGKPAGLNSGGYVVDIAESIKIPGWRLNQNEVAKFEFGRVGKSYAVQGGHDATNVGVIGLMVFRDGKPFNPYEYFHKTRPWDTDPKPYDPYKDIPPRPGPIWYEGGQYREPPMMSDSTVRSTYSNTGPVQVTASNSLESSQNVGTGFGGVQWFKTTGTRFEKRDPNNPDEMMVIFYDNARGLEKRGIVVERKKYRSPDPFPTYIQSGCKPPLGWTK